MRIGFTYNKKRIKEGDEEAEFDSEETIMTIKRALELHNEVVMIEADEDAFNKLKNSKLDFVFNTAEGLRGECRESQIPMYCELLKIHYTGSGPSTLGITLNKARTKEVLSYYKIPTPRFWVFKDADTEMDVNFPVIVKPIREGSSKGIKNDSLIKNEKDLRRKLREIINDYKQDAIVEEFLDGREFTVSLIGNKNVEVLPIVEVRFDFLPGNINKFDSYEAKWIYDNPNSKFDPLICPAKITKKIEEDIKKNCVNAFNVLGCRDLCRIDIRLDKKNIPNILDVNALPGLIPDPKENSRFPRAAYTKGMKYEELINRILNEAIVRYNL